MLGHFVRRAQHVTDTVSTHKRAALAVGTMAIAVALIAPLGVATADSDTVVYSGTTLHSPNDSRSFDISWVEQSTGRYYLADRTNAAVDWFDLTRDVNGDAFAAFLGQGQFVGTGPAVCAVPHACGGPNGVVTDKQHRVWAADGPQGGVNSLKMIDPHLGQSVAKTITLGGKFRADELAYDPRQQVIEVASDADGFLSFVSTVPGSEHVISTFYYADNLEGQPASVAGLKTPGNGIEQPVWDPQTGLFYQALPGNPTDGRIDVFRANGRYVTSFAATGCGNGPTGLVLTSEQQLVGACDNGALVMEVHSGRVRTIVPNLGGADELWFNPGDNNVYFAESAAGQLGVMAAEGDRYVTSLPTQTGSHSVAAWASRPNQILVPLVGNGIKVFVSEGRRGEDNND